MKIIKFIAFFLIFISFGIAWFGNSGKVETGILTAVCLLFMIWNELILINRKLL